MKTLQDFSFTIEKNRVVRQFKASDADNQKLMGVLQRLVKNAESPNEKGSGNN